MKKTRSVSQSFFKTFFVVAFLLQMGESLANDSTKIKLPRTKHLVLCPMPPNLKDPNQCHVYTAAGENQATLRSKDDVYQGQSVVYRVDKATCDDKGEFNVFAGFRDLGFIFSTGVNSNPRQGMYPWKTYHCCKQIARWVPADDCKALK